MAHPRYSLAQGEDLARAAFGMGARNCDQDAVAQQVGYKNSLNGAFKGIRAATSYFGLITYRDDRYLSVSEPWIEALHSGEQEGIRRLRQDAVQQPELYRQLIEEFSGRQLPSVEKLARQLHLTPKYGILKDAAETAAKVFLESVKFADFVDTYNYLRIGDAPPEADASIAVSTALSSPELGESPAVESAPAVNVGLAFPINTMPADPTLDRLEVQLAGGRKAYLFVPVPMPAREKERLKKYIDLILEPDEPTLAGGK